MTEHTQREVERWRYLSEYRNVRERDGIVTGVMSGNDVKWEYMPYDWTCIDCEAAYEEWLAQKGDMEEWDEEWDDIQECNGHTHLYGDWVKDDDGKYSIDENGTYGYAAIYNSNENTMQVVHSKIARWTEWCSPCYPHQGNVEEDSPLISGDRPWRVTAELTFERIVSVIKALVEELPIISPMYKEDMQSLLNDLISRLATMYRNVEVHNEYWITRAYGGGVTPDQDRYDWLRANGWTPLEHMSSQSVINRINPISSHLAFEIAGTHFNVQKSVAAYSLPITSEEWELLDWMIENYKEGE